MIKITGMWKNVTKDGRVYYSAKCGNVKYLLYPVKEKSSLNAPDVELYIAKNEKTNLENE